MVYEWRMNTSARLWISSFPGFGSRSLRRLRESAIPWETWWTADVHRFSRIGIQESPAARFCAWRASFDTEALSRLMERDAIRVVFPEETAFPTAFRAMADPPEVLFVRGVLKSGPAVSVVGTRRMTAYGVECVERIVPELTRQGCSVVSGLALGVDGAAHRAALKTNGYTIAVLGAGVEDAGIYPREHLGLAHEILARRGALLSEFPPGSESRKEHFPIRNRLIAAYGLATIVIEAAMDSGSLITAKLALEENREVLAVPGPIWNEQSAGTNHLLRLGAHVCTNAQDVLDAIKLDRPDLTIQARASLPEDAEERRLLELLSEPRHIDELGRMAGLEAARIASLLAVLEVKGWIVPIGGRMYVRHAHV